MDFIHLSNDEATAEIRINRGKVNALNEQVIEELAGCFERLAVDPQVRAVLLTADGPFFSFGFDIPEFLGYSKESFARFAKKFTGLYTNLFEYPKPVVAALNGHAIAGGCMLSLACDYRIMVSGKARISLNEITFGSSVFGSSAAMLKFIVGGRNAQAILYDGAMYSAEEALKLGMIDQVSTPDRLIDEARILAKRLGEIDPNAFTSVKALLRSPVAEEMRAKDTHSVQEFIEIWYSANTWQKLQTIQIYS